MNNPKWSSYYSTKKMMKMKNIIKISFLLILLVSKMQAQTNRAGVTAIPAGIFSVNGKTFNAIIDTMTFASDGRRMSPNTMQIILVGGDMTSQAAVNIAGAAGQIVTRECLKSVFSYDIEEQKADFVRFFNIMRSVFSASRITDIMNYDDKGIKNISFYIDPSGVVKDVMITITENTIITPAEIELLYTRMLTQMSLSTSPSGCSVEVRFFKYASVRKQRELYTNPYYFGNGPVWDNK